MDRYIFLFTIFCLILKLYVPDTTWSFFIDSSTSEVINWFRLNQHLTHLFYISLYIILSYAFRRTSALSSGSLVCNCSIFGASAGCKHLSKRVGEMRSSYWCTIFQDFAKVTCHSSGQVITSGWCAENRTIKYETTWRRRRNAPKCVGERDVASYVQ